MSLRQLAWTSHRTGWVSTEPTARCTSATAAKPAAAAPTTIRIATGRDTVGSYCPFHTGSRFSKKAFTPSSMSSVESASVS